ncbi:MAG: MgtC/SapB family protein [Polyangia bacterium]
MDHYEPFVSFTIALLSGLLIGIEREQTQEAEADKDGSGFLGGARTYPLFALLGALAMFLRKAVGPWLLLLALAGVVTLIAISYVDDLRSKRGRGLTTEASILVTFMLGVLSAAQDLIQPTSQRVIVVAALGVIITLILSSKPWLQQFLRRVSRDDLYATVKFLIVAVLVLPLLPNRPFGPLQVLNPFNIGLMVALIAGVSFVGYVAIRVLGPGRGMAVTALVGGLVSSTAVTLSCAGRARREPPLTAAAALGIVLASSIMSARVLIEVTVVHLPLLRSLIFPIGAMMLTGGAVSVIFYLSSRAGAPITSDMRFSNPFELSSAVKFGSLFALVLVGSKAAQLYAGTRGMYAAALLAGLTDVDAITLSTANLARDGMPHSVAATTIMLGVTANSIVKAVMASTIGGKALALRVAPAFLVMLAGGGVGLALMWLVR